MNGSEKPGIYTKYEKLFQQTILEEYQQIECARVLHRFPGVKYDLTPTQACLRLVSEAPPHWANGLLQECELKNFVNGIADFVLYVNVAKLRAQYGDADENAFSWLTTRALNNDTGIYHQENTMRISMPHYQEADYAAESAHMQSCQPNCDGKDKRHAKLLLRSTSTAAGAKVKRFYQTVKQRRNGRKGNLAAPPKS
ncbi:hypothetical protein T265_07369 [Opisthorchis viverrini]|uniref:Uncharacterized protein n=1 Tax=Opisthorchis viverrini TaxID=6198 RepID=A0A074ZDA0_OPIVI|nr:hypothetical protein T265_07369 [Opisthorchis viverrini]KER25148.1 hypothetical protein T265_07369 [Opisthorchis viverrini]